MNRWWSRNRRSFEEVHDRQEEAQAVVGRAGERVDGVLGMRHQAGDTSVGRTDPGDVTLRAIRDWPASARTSLPTYRNSTRPSALTISTGFVVDDAIVVLENISRYLEQGMPRVEAAIRGAAKPV